MADVRLIDANALRLNWLENGQNEYLYDTNAVLDSIDVAPTIEAVPVMRCLKCRHARELTYAEGIRFTSDCLVCMNPHGAGVSYPEYNMDGRVVWKSGYCSYGDQKHDGGTEDD